VGQLFLARDKGLGKLPTVGLLAGTDEEIDWRRKYR
jgi:hypothetical protein